MKSAKRFVIWAVLMIVTVFCVNLIGTLVVKLVLANTVMPVMTGYSKKGEMLLHPTLKEPDEKNKSNGLSGLVMRSVLGDIRLDNNSNFLSNFIFINGTVDQTTIMFDKDGMSEFSKGIFAVVYKDTGEFSSYMKNTVGLISVSDFSKLDCAKKICETLENYPDAVVRLDSYSIENFAVQPASLTILEGSFPVNSFDCPVSGKVIKAEDVYIYDDNKSGSNGNELHSFCNQLKLAFLGERRSDKAAEKLIEEVDFSGDTFVQKSTYGLGHYIARAYEVNGDYAMIVTFDYTFYSGLILYSAIFCVPITLLTFLLGRKKKEVFY